MNNKWDVNFFLIVLLTNNTSLKVFQQLNNIWNLFFLHFVIEHKATFSRFFKCPPQPQGGCPRGVMVKAMDYGIVVREFVLQSHYYVHFRANTLGKGMNPLILPAMD